MLSALDTGLYVSNLWYLNFSDKPAARMTGMTRFATFWVDKGEIVAPVTPLRFDDTLYRMLGEKLVELTRSRELLLSTSTYDERSTSSSRLPGALLECPALHAVRFSLTGSRCMPDTVRKVEYFSILVSDKPAQGFQRALDARELRHQPARAAAAPNAAGARRSTSSPTTRGASAAR